MECPHFVASRLPFPGTCRRPPHSLPSLSPHSFPSPRGGYSSSRPNLQAEPSVRSPNSPAYLTCTTTQAHPQVPSRPPACGGTAAALGKTTSPHRAGGWLEGVVVVGRREVRPSSNTPPGAQMQKEFLRWPKSFGKCKQRAPRGQRGRTPGWESPDRPGRARMSSHPRAPQ